METLVIPGLPADLASIFTVVIGLIASMLVGPLTAIWKKAGKTEGPTTVGISAVLSLIVGIIYAVISASSGGAFNIVQALVVAVVAFVKSNGSYIMAKQATAGGVEKAVSTPKPLPTIDDDTLNRPATAEDFGPSMKIE